jgi:hypothetical protein
MGAGLLTSGHRSSQACSQLLLSERLRHRGRLARCGPLPVLVATERGAELVAVERAGLFGPKRLVAGSAMQDAKCRPLCIVGLQDRRDGSERLRFGSGVRSPRATASAISWPVSESGSGARGSKDSGIKGGPLRSQPVDRLDHAHQAGDDRFQRGDLAHHIGDGCVVA